MTQTQPDRSAAKKLGITHDMVVQELGWDEDTDDAVRAEIEEAIGGELLDEDTDEVVDVVLLWWREGDGDLVDELLNVVTPLADDGVIWVLTPKEGRPGHVALEEIAANATPAGLSATSTVRVSEIWSGTRLSQPKAKPHL